MSQDDTSTGRQRRGRSLKTTFDLPDFVMEVTEEKPESRESVNLVFNRRRHTTVHKSGLDGVGLLPSFPQAKPAERRFSLMPADEATRRMSLGITDAQRETLKLPRFSKVFGFSTFSGLPMMDYHDPVIDYENTYRMEPVHRFQISKVKQVIEKIVDDLLYWDDDVLIDEGQKPDDEKEREKYEAQKHRRRRDLTKKIVDEVKDEVKELNYSRYKYVVNAMVGEVKGQGMRVASRCLWNTDTDRSVCVERKGRDGYVVVIVHAIYFE